MSIFVYIMKCVCSRVHLWHGLAVPVVDLLDIAEDNLVFSSHLLWNPSDLQPGHEALRNVSREHVVRLD